jgi:hypothetical protein
MKIRLESGEEAQARAFDGNLLTLLSPRVFAPGSPIRFVATPNDEERSFEGRAIRSKRVDDLHFEVRMRLVNLRREDRELLLTQIADCH